MDIIDFHTHIFPDDLAKRAIEKICSNSSEPKHYTDGTASGLLDSMEKNGIAHSVLLSIATKPSQVHIINQTCISLKSDHFIPFGTLHPLMDNIEEEICFLKHNTIKGIKLHPEYQNFFINDKKILPMYEQLSAENISSILTPVLTHDINSVTALIEAGSYNNAISASNSIHASYAKLLDSNRDLGGLDSVYATLDLSSDSQIQDVLTSWAPEAEMTVRSLAKATTDALSQFHSSRLRIMETGSWSGGSISVMGSLGKIASHQDAMAPMSNVVVSDMDNEASIKTNKKIADDYSIYLAGSFIDGNASVMPFSSNLEKEHFDGWTLSAGIEHAVSENIKLGASLSYTDLSLNDQAAKSVNSNHAAVTLYGQLQSKSNLVLSGQFSIGSFDTSTERNIVFPASYSLSSEDENLSVASKVQLSRPLKMSDFTVIPKMGLQTAMVDFNDVLETGGVTALNIDRKYYSSTQGRLGLDIVSNKNSNFYWRISGDVVNEFDDSLNMFRAGFAQSNGEHANFLLAGTDQFWGEVGAGIAFEIDKAVMSLSVDTTVGRDDLSTQSYRAGITLKF